MRPMPTTDEYVNAFLTAMRAEPNERTMFTSAGRSKQRSRGERVLYGPNGAAIRVLEDPQGHTQVEHGDRLHAVIRPPTVQVRVDRETGEIIR